MAISMDPVPIWLLDLQGGHYNMIIDHVVLVTCPV